MGYNEVGYDKELNEVQYDTEAVRDWLMEYRSSERDLDNQTERLERLVSKMTSVGAQVLSDLPKSPNETGDRFGDYVAKKDELEKDIACSLRQQKKSRSQLERMLKHIRNPDERAVIRMRYLDVMSWAEVNDLMFGGREDFLDKEETYLRRVYRVHGNAILHIAMYLEDNQP